MIIVGLLPAAWDSSSPFPAAIGTEIIVAPTGVTIPKGYRNLNGHDFVFTRYAR